MLLPCIKRCVVTLFLIAGFFDAFAQKPDPLYKIDASAGWVQTKNYYLLTLFEQDAAVKNLLATDPELVKLTKAKTDAINAALNCKDVGCFLSNDKFSDADISLVSERLQVLYKPGSSLDKLVQIRLIPSGMYIMYKDLSPADLLVKAWEQDAAGVNYTIDVICGRQKAELSADRFHQF